MVKLISSIMIAFIQVSAIGLLHAGQKTVAYYETDHLGSPVLITNEMGGTGWKADYDAWGKLLQSAAGNEGDIGFTGHYFEPGLELTYAQARWLDPSSGGFLSVDPVKFSVSTPRHFNRFIYADGSPVSMMDPTGRDGLSVNFQLNAPGITGPLQILQSLLPDGHSLKSQVIPEGFEAGIASSFDGFTRAKKQIGAGAGVIVGGELGVEGSGPFDRASDLVKGLFVPGVTLEIEYNRSSQDALSIVSGESPLNIGGHYRVAGGGVLVDKDSGNGVIDGVFLTLGSGFNIGATMTRKKGFLFYE